MRASARQVHRAFAVENYRAGHDLALKSRRGQASTDDLRQALVHYRVPFEALVEGSPSALAVAR